MGAKVATQTRQRDESIAALHADGWASFPNGSLCCGPGSYYLDSPNITQMHENITTLHAVRDYVTQFNLKEPENPVIMFQLTNPWSDPGDKKPQYLVFHRREFLSQNLDGSSGKSLEDGFALDISRYQQGKRFGSPMFYAPNSGVPNVQQLTTPASVEEEQVEMEGGAGRIEGVEGHDRSETIAALHADGWASFPNGSLCCGPGSYYLDSPNITQMHENITTLHAVRDYVNQFNLKEPENPAIMFQLTNPWSDPGDKKPQYLVFHRREFLSQNLDGSSGKSLEDGFALDVSRYQQGKRFGSPMFYAPNSGVPRPRENVEQLTKAAR